MRMTGVVGRAPLIGSNAMIGGKALPALFDSGFNGTIRVPPSTFAALELIPHGATAPYCGTASGETELIVGGVAVTTTVCSRAVESVHPVAIGALTFAAFRSVVIDYPDHLLQFIK